MIASSLRKVGYEYRRESNREPRSVVSSGKIRRGRSASTIAFIALNVLLPASLAVSEDSGRSLYGFERLGASIRHSFLRLEPPTEQTSKYVLNVRAKFHSAKRAVYVPRAFEVREERLFHELGIFFTAIEPLLWDFLYN